MPAAAEMVIRASVFALAVFWMQSQDLPAQESPQRQAIQMDGVVIQQQKYSFMLQGLDDKFQVLIPNGTPVLLRLNRPEIDLEKHQLRIMLPNSAVDGNAKNNRVLTYQLPEKLFLSAAFASREIRNEFAGRVAGKRVNRFILSDKPSSGPLTLSGELRSAGRDGEFVIQNESASYAVTLGPRRGLLSGFSILDLKPHVTDVFVQGQYDGQTVVASQIEFAHVGDPLEYEDPALPRCLFLGDSISFNYQRGLREALAGKVNLHHPPTSCGGSNNWRQLHRWLGNYEHPDRGWDVISFNFGLHDQRTTKAAYQTNLQRCIRQLEKTGAQLIWVATTPIPHGFANPSNSNGPLIGHVPGRMNLQNKWAQEVLEDFPNILVCDLWSVVQRGRDKHFAQWWAGKTYGFDYLESLPLGRELAKKILVASGDTESDINPIVTAATAQSKTDR